MTTQTTQQTYLQKYGHVMTVSAWGFVIVFASLLFLYLGHLLDEWLGTAPNFMFGLFFLAVVTSIGRLYQEAWKKRKDVEGPNQKQTDTGSFSWSDQKPLFAIVSRKGALSLHGKSAMELNLFCCHRSEIGASRGFRRGY